MPFRLHRDLNLIKRKKPFSTRIIMATKKKAFGANNWGEIPIMSDDDSNIRNETSAAHVNVTFNFISFNSKIT